MTQKIGLFPAPKSSQRATKRWQRMRHEWRIGQPILFHQFLIAAAETLDEQVWQQILAESDARQLIVTPERAAHLNLETQHSALALNLTNGTKLEQVWNAIDPTRLSSSCCWKNAVAAPYLPAKDIDHLLQQMKRTGLLPSLILASLSAEQLLHWQQHDTAVLHDSDLHHSIDPVGLIALPPARVPMEGADDERIHTFRDAESGLDHLAVLIGSPGDTPLLRVHSSCLTGDVLGSLRCDCGPQLRGAIDRMNALGGILLYLNQEGRGIGFGNKMRAYRLQDAGLDTMDANRALGFADDERSFVVAADMLKQLGVSAVRLLTNNPNKAAQLTQHGIRIAERVPHQFGANSHNQPYLDTKKNKGGHLF